MENKHVNTFTQTQKEEIMQQLEKVLATLRAEPEKPEPQRLVEEAFANGMPIQSRPRSTVRCYEWQDNPAPIFDWSGWEYRIKPQPEKPAEWKAGDMLSGAGEYKVRFEGYSGAHTFEGFDHEGYHSKSFIRDCFRFHSRPTPEERIRFDRIVENAKLKAEWEKEPFQVQFRMPGCEWYDCSGPQWNDMAGGEYRRKPEPCFVLWTAEDARKVRDIWVRRKLFKDQEFRFGCISDRYVYLQELGRYSFKALFNDFEQLDGTPCGRQAEVAE